MPAGMPTDKRSASDEVADVAIRHAVVYVRELIDCSEHDRTIPPSSSDLWVSIHVSSMIYMIRDQLKLVSERVYLDSEIIRVWLAVRKNPGVKKAEMPK